jgi:hypothetical protein
MDLSIQAFLGSMLYELIPSGANDFTWSHFITTDNFIRYAIILFYSLDYMHLYGDMDSLIQDPQKKGLSYFVVDILTCFCYVGAFIALKIPRYWPSYIVFAAVPWLFLWYKRRNIQDRKFFVVYGSVATVIVFYRLVCRIYPQLTTLSDETLVLLFLVFNLVVYWYYVGFFYETKSRSNDEQIYSQ